MTAYLAPQFDTQFFDGSTVAAGYKLYTYDSGTTTPKATYTDQGGASANTNPIILDSNGRCSLWLGTGEYTFTLKTDADVLVKTWNDVGGAGSADSVAAYDAAIRDDLASSAVGKGSKLVAFINRLTGAVARWVEDKLSETISVKDFGAKGDGTTDDAAAIRAAIAAAAGGTVYFPVGTYLCATQLGTITCSLVGAGRNYTTLIYSGTAAPFIGFGDAEYKGLTLKYSNNGLTGDFTATIAPSRFSKIYWGSVGGITTAASCLNINSSTQVKIEMSHLTNAVICLQGQKAGGFATVAKVDSCILGNYVTAAISDGGQGWEISNCGFEPNTVGQVVALKTTGALLWEGLSLSGCWFGDVTSSTPTAMIQLKANGVNMSGNFFEDARGVHTVLQITGTSQGFVVTGNTAKAFAKFIDFGATTCTDFVVLGNHISSGTNYTYSTNPPSGSTVLGLFGNKSNTYIPGMYAQTYSVATLPAASSLLAGTKAFVIDSSVTTFNSNVAGGGANYVPVFTDGTNWKVG